MTYKLIEECGLEVYRANLEIKGQMQDVVLTTDLEAFLQKAVRVYNPPEQDATWITAKGDWCSREALLINIQPIPKLEPVSVGEIITALVYVGRADGNHREALELIERLKSAGVKND